MFKRQQFFMLILFSFFAISILRSQTEIQHEFPLQDLMNRLPTEDSLEQSLVLRAILEYRTDGILKICEQLDAPDSNKFLAAQYALTGLSHYVSTAGKDHERKWFMTAIENALLGDLSIPQKAFLITQLQNCATEESIPTLSRFLFHDRLAEPAIQSLLTIGGSKAGKALLKALSEVKEKNRITMIKALGELRYEPSAKKIMAFVADPELKQIALFALANMGYLPAEKLLEEAASENSNDYLTFAGRLAKKGHAVKSIAICQKILTNREQRYNNHARIAALTLLVDLKGSRAMNDIQSVMTENDKKMRVAALRLAEKFNEPMMTRKWIDLIPTCDSEIQAGIIDMLGRQQAVEAIPIVRQKMNTGQKLVRMAAISTITKIHSEKAVPDLMDALQQSTDDDERNAIKQMLLTLPNHALLPIINDRMSQVPPQSKILLIEILNDRSVTEMTPLLMTQLQSENQELRIETLKALQKCAGKNELQALTQHLFTSENGSEQRAAVSAVAVAVKKSQDQKWIFDQLRQFYDRANSTEKIAMFDVLKMIGGERAVQFILPELKNNALKDAAIRTLVDWRDETALEPLFRIAQAEQDETHRILAIQGAVRILRENPMGDIRAVEFYQRFMQIAERPQEQRMILAGLAAIKSSQSLRFVAQFLDDDSLSYEATLAAVKIASTIEEADENLSPEQVALAMIEANANKNLLGKLDVNPIIEQKHNQPPAGFDALFNGKDLFGWKGLVENPVKRAKMTEEELAQAQMKADSIMRAHWKVIDGMLYFDGGGQSLCTVNDYANFELLVDWKIEKHGDSGIYLRGSPQVQIWDGAQWPEGSGGLYNNQNNPSEPLQRADNPIGEWNTFHIIMRGEKVTVYLNDVLVVDHVVLENYWERDKPIYPCGQIELQAHHSPLYFRNIFIRELSDELPLFDGALFNGIDLTGWQVIGNDESSWKVENGILYTDGSGGGWISTTKEFANFKLELEFRIPPEGNSGVFIRAPHEGNPAFAGMEIQVLDDYATKYTDLQPWQYTGSIYGVQAPSERASKKANEWQKMVIFYEGSQISVTLNDRQIINANLIDFMHLESSHPGIKERKGYIGLQNHNTKIEYRHIRLIELE